MVDPRNIHMSNLVQEMENLSISYMNELGLPDEDRRYVNTGIV